MKPWINEDIFKTWTDAQKRLWESLCAAVPFQPPAGVETWRETYLKNLTTWEAAVKKTLTQEATWVQQWVHQIAQEKGTPDMMNAWIHQMEDVLQRWIQTQHQWWDDYFALLRQGESVAAAEFTSTQPVSAVASEPAVVVEPEPVVIAKPEPAVVVEAVQAVLKPVVVQSEPVVAAEPVPAAPTAEAPAAPKPAQPDDLKLIAGIGQALEKKLRKQGIISYRQLATLNDADIARIEAIIKFPGRIRRDNWIGQANTLHFQKYQEAL